MRQALPLVIVFTALLARASGVPLRAQSPGAPGAVDLQARLQQVGERLAKYYDRARSLVCLEKVVVLPMNNGFSGFGEIGRELKYELHLEWTPPGGDGPGQVKLVRELIAIGGRAPRAKDKRKCLDPRPESGDPRDLLLPEGRPGYRFKLAGTGKSDGRAAFMIDFKPLNPGKPEYVQTDDDDPDCTTVSLPLPQGRLWIDEDTNDVLRLDEFLASGAEVDIPKKNQIAGGPTWLSFDRYNVTTRFKAVSFEDPEETLVLPVSSDAEQVVRNSGHVRTTHTYSNYRRFVTGGRIVGG